MDVQPSSSFTPAHYLDWKERPTPLQERIDSVFKKLSKGTVLSAFWMCDGSYEVEMMHAHIREYRLVKEIINGSVEREEFYVIDVGAGKGRWGRGLANFLSGQEDLRSKIKVHIFNTRGERWEGPPKIEIGPCILHELGAFQVETISESFQEKGWNLEQKVDLIASRWCLRHLVDPLGTFLQMYNLLRPLGYCVMDGFFFSYGHQSHPEYFQQIYIQNMIRLLLDMEVPFLMDIQGDRELGNYFLKKPYSTPCQIPMHYIGFTEIGDGWACHASSITEFACEQLEGEYEYPKERRDLVAGDMELYKECKQKGLFTRSTIELQKIRF